MSEVRDDSDAALPSLSDHRGRSVRFSIGETLVIVGLLGGGIAWATNLALSQGRQSEKIATLDAGQQSINQNLSALRSIQTDSRERLIRIETLLKADGK